MVDDPGEGGGIKWPKNRWRNMWTAPKFDFTSKDSFYIAEVAANFYFWKLPHFTWQNEDKEKVKWGKGKGKMRCQIESLWKQNIIFKNESMPQHQYYERHLFSSNHVYSL